MPDKHKCDGRVWNGWNHVSCSKNALLEHNGLWFCKTHHPPTVEAKRKAKTTKWEEEWEQKRKIRDHQRVVDDARLEAVDILSEIHNTVNSCGKCIIQQDSQFDRIKACLEKALSRA